MPAKARMPVLTNTTCGCGVQDTDLGDVRVDGTADSAPRYAVAVDADRKQRNIRRLRRIEGQVRGLQGMIEADRYCADILMQLSSVQEALRAVSRELMRNHLKHCVTRAIRSGDDTAEPMYDELVDLIYKHSR